MFAEIEEVGIGEGIELIARRAIACIRHPDGNELLGDGKRQRLQEHRVNHAEDGGVRADAEAEGEHGDDGEAGMFEELAQSVADVGHHILDL